jgi:hypothetical protein
MKRDLNHFVFSGLMAVHAARDMEASGVLRSRTASAPERDGQDCLHQFRSTSELDRLKCSGPFASCTSWRTLFET